MALDVLSCLLVLSPRLSLPSLVYLGSFCSLAFWRSNGSINAIDCHTGLHEAPMPVHSGASSLSVTFQKSRTDNALRAMHVSVYLLVEN